MKEISTSTDSRGKIWERMILNNVKIDNDEYRIGFVTKNPYGLKYSKGDEFSVGVSKIKGKSFDYSKEFSSKDHPQTFMVLVIEAFPKNHSPWIIEILVKKSYCGYNDLSISVDKEQNLVIFASSWGEDVDPPATTLPYPSAIKLFHAYFNAFKTFVEEYAPEFMVETTREVRKLDENGKPIYEDIKWYPKFLTELKKFNALYDEMVKKGEIVEGEE